MLNLARGERVTLFYGTHHDRRAAADCTAASRAYAAAVAGALGADLRAGDATSADRDFCAMLGADRFIQGRGGFSQLVADLRARRGRPTETLAGLADWDNDTAAARRRPARRRPPTAPREAHGGPDR
jgi:hypothetical protein